MQKHSRSATSSQNFWRLILTLCSVFLLAVGHFDSANAQEASESWATPVAQVEPTEADTDSEVIEPSDTPSPDTAAGPLTDNVDTDQGESESDQPAVDPTETTQPLAIPSIEFVLPKSAECLEASANISGVLAPGHAIEYACAYRVKFSGTDITTEDIAAAFSVEVSVPVGTTTRVRTTPGLEEWGEAHSDPFLIQPGDVDANAIEIANDSSAESGSVSGTILFSFGLLTERPFCAEATGELAVWVRPELSNYNAEFVSTILDPGQTAEILAPLLPAVDFAPPIVAIESIAIDPIAFSLDEQSIPVEIHLLVEQRAFVCVEYAIELSLTFTGATEAIFGSSSAREVPSLALTGESGSSVIVGFVPIGLDAGQERFSVAIDMSIPAGLAAGAFGVSAVASISAVVR